jgi:hypothetical protein
MTATAASLVTTRRPSRSFAELRVIRAVLAIIVLSLVLSVALAVSVTGAVKRSGIELPAPGPMPQPTIPANEPATPSVPEPMTAPPGLDL